MSELLPVPLEWKDSEPQERFLGGTFTQKRGSPLEPSGWNLKQMVLVLTLDDGFKVELFERDPGGNGNMLPCG